MRCGVGDGRDRFGGHRARLVARAGEDVDHRRLRTDRELQRLRRVDLDDLDADGPNRRVVDIARVRRDDDLVPGETGEVRNAHVQVGVAASHARGGRVRHRRRASGAHHAPLGAGQLGQSLAHGLHDLVEVGKLLIRRALGRAHFRQFDRAADDRQRAAAIDEWAHPDRLVHVGIDRGRRRSDAPGDLTG